MLLFVRSTFLYLLNHGLLRLSGSRAERPFFRKNSSWVRSVLVTKCSGPVWDGRHMVRRVEEGSKDLMRTIRPSWVLLLITGLLAAGCTGTVPFGGLRGSGDLITESRTVSGFDEIVVLGHAGLRDAQRDQRR